MKKDVIISIRGLQSYDGCDDDAIELITNGTLTRTEENSYTLSYAESELTGLNGTQTTFRILPNQVTLMRHGEVCSEMVFEEGKKHRSVYETPYGSLEVGISAQMVHSTIDDMGGRLEIDYAIEIDHSMGGQNRFRIQVRPQ